VVPGTSCLLRQDVVALHPHLQDEELQNLELEAKPKIGKPII